jgi:hypothetical protein
MKCLYQVSGHVYVYWSVDFASFYNFSIRLFHCSDRWYFFYQFHSLCPFLLRGRRGRDRMVVGFTTTRPISKVGVRTPFMARCNRYNIMWYSLSVTCGRSVDFCLYSTNKTDSNDITDILLKMALNTLNQTK